MNVNSAFHSGNSHPGLPRPVLARAPKCLAPLTKDRRFIVINDGTLTLKPDVFDADRLYRSFLMYNYSIFLCECRGDMSVLAHSVKLLIQSWCLPMQVVFIFEDGSHNQRKASEGEVVFATVQWLLFHAEKTLATRKLRKQEHKNNIMLIQNMTPPVVADLATPSPVTHSTQPQPFAVTPSISPADTLSVPAPSKRNLSSKPNKPKPKKKASKAKAAVSSSPKKKSRSKKSKKGQEPKQTKQTLDAFEPLPMSSLDSADDNLPDIPQNFLEFLLQGDDDTTTSDSADKVVNTTEVAVSSPPQDHAGAQLLSQTSTSMQSNDKPCSESAAEGDFNQEPMVLATEETAVEKQLPPKDDAPTLLSDESHSPVSDTVAPLDPIDASNNDSVLEEFGLAPVDADISQDELLNQLEGFVY